MERYAVSVTLPPRLEQMQIVRNALDSLAGAHALSSRATSRLQIVLDELISNAINHGHRGADGAIKVDMRIEDAVFTLSLTDRGARFDPSVPPFADLAERPRIGGRGLDMVRALTDSMTYRREGNRNHTIITKAVAPEDQGRPHMIAGLTIDETRSEGAATVVLEGRIDSGNASQLTEHLTGLVTAGHHKVTIDMSKLGYLTSAGFRTLLVVSDAAEDVGGGLMLTSLTEEVRELFDLSGLSKAFVIH